MKRTYTTDTPQVIGQQISVSGWVNSRRDHGGLIFIDLRDHTGIVQLVINPETPEAFACAEQLRDEQGTITAVRVSALTGEGLDLLRAALIERATPTLAQAHYFTEDPHHE